MRVQRPSWFEPLDSVGEWVGFLGGIVVAVGLGAFCFLLVRGIADSVSVSVRNDRNLAVEIIQCGGEIEFVDPGHVFQIEGLPKHDQLTCLVSYREGQEQCIVIPRVRSIKRTIDLSQLMPVPRSRCD